MNVKWEQEGFTLLEVMIAMLLLTFTLLAIASGEITALGTNRTANDVSLATASAEEIIERMHRNRDNLISYNGMDTSNVVTRPPTPGMAQTDYDQWQAGMIAGGRGRVQVASTTPISTAIQVTVTIDNWPSVPPRTVQIETIFF